MSCNCSEWTKGLTPRTNNKAKPSCSSHVRGVTAIRVTNATYRGSPVFSGEFEMVHPERDPRQFQGTVRVEVYCCWHGAKSPTTFPNINVSTGSYQILSNYTGPVIRNIE
jgi:hypothetical protein